MNVYHFTDTVRLPWILDSGELRPGKATIGDYPKSDEFFIWATRDDRGCRTATVENFRELYQHGLLFIIRITLDAADFQPWKDVIRSMPGWTEEHIKRLADSGRRLGDNPDNWFCATNPIPISHWQATHWRAYRQYKPGWTPYLINLTNPVVRGPQGLAVTLNDVTVFSDKFQRSDTGTTAYKIRLPKGNLTEQEANRLSQLQFERFGM